MNEQRPYRGWTKDGKEKRGWYGEDKDGKCWIYHLAYASDTSSYMTFTDVIKSTVGQVTGLKDKNGVEIYEGDIIQFTNIKKSDEMLPIEAFIDTAVVEWEDGMFKIDGDDEGIVSQEPIGYVISRAKCSDDFKLNIKVIGSIHTEADNE